MFESIKLAQNNIICDVYVGTGSGTQIDKKLNEATTRIKIISPYISASCLGILKRKYCFENVEVQLLTSQDCFKEKHLSKTSNIYDFFTEEILVDVHNKALSERWTYAEKTIYVLAMILSGYILYSGIPMFKELLQKEITGVISYLNNLWKYCLQRYQEIIGVAVLIIIGKLFRGFALEKKSKIRSHYKYSRDFPMKFADTINLHSKIYVIDNSVYIGSVNFTEQGFRYNFETRIKITDGDTVEKFNKLFDDIYNSCPYEIQYDYKNIKKYTKKIEIDKEKMI